jgi:hypothetical protein
LPNASMTSWRVWALSLYTRMRSGLVSGTVQMVLPGDDAGRWRPEEERAINTARRRCRPLAA